MAASSLSGNPTVRINNLDWQILEVMADGKRYTPSYLGNDVEELNDYKADYIRRRVTDLYGYGLLKKEGESSMYKINERGETALRLRDEGTITDETSPNETRKLIAEHSE